MHITNLRKQLAETLDQVQASQNPVIVTKNSKPVAMIVPFDQSYNRTKHVKDLIEMNTSWFDNDDYNSIRSEVQDRLKTV